MSDVQIFVLLAMGLVLFFVLLVLLMRCPHIWEEVAHFQLKSPEVPVDRPPHGHDYCLRCRECGDMKRVRL